MFFDWHPTVVHDLHESVALLMSWNGTGPYNPNIDPITFTEFQSLSFHEVQTLTSFGMPGVSTWNFGEAFAHLYLDSVAMNHNSIGRGYETFGNGTAETLQWTLSPDETSREWYRVSPAPSTPFLWSARDNVNYNETAALAALDMAATQSKTLLRSFYRKGFNSWRKGVDEAAVRIRDRSGSGRSAARGATHRAPAVAAHRSTSLERRVHGEGRLVRCRHVRRAARPTVSQLRGGSAGSAGLSEERRRAVRRCVVGAARALSRHGGRDRRSDDQRCWRRGPDGSAAASR